MRSIKLPSWTKSLFGLDPVPVPPHAFSIDNRSLRYGGFHRSPQGGLVFDTYRSVELDPGTFAHGPLGGPPQDPKPLKETVGAFCSALPAPAKSACLVLPDAWLRL